MIDTLRFKIELTDLQLKNLISVSTELKQTNNESKKVDFSFNKIQKPLGSFYRNIMISIDQEESCCYLEFSLPKQIIGHNIYMLNPKNLIEQLSKIHRDICKKVAYFPEPFWWEFYRVDLCYAWQMLDDISTQSTIALLQSLNYPRKKTYKYGTSVMFMGSTYSVKFYMKSAEYLVHDFKELRKGGFELMAYDLLKSSRGILRFEISLRKKALQQIFKISSKSSLLIADSLTEEKILKILNSFLEPLLKMKSDVTTTKQEGASRLLRFYKPSKAARLYSFMNLYYSTDSTDKMMIQDFDRTVVWRNLKDLVKAQVGIPSDVRGTVPLKIPSPFAVPIV